MTEHQGEHSQVTAQNQLFRPTERGEDTNARPIQVEAILPKDSVGSR